MDRDTIEQEITALKRYYNPAKSNYRRLDNLITSKADYFDIVQTLEEIKGIRNTPEKVYNFIENIIAKAKDLYNAQIKIEYEKTQIQKKLIEIEENHYESEKNNVDFTAAKSNLIILSIVLTLILTMTAVCALFYKICL